MNMFDAELKRAFAEAEEPVDDGFVVKVASGVARHERAKAFAANARLGALVAGGAATVFGVFQIAKTVGLNIMATLGLGLAQAHGALSGAGLDAGAAQHSLSQSIAGIGLTQLLIVAVVACGGAYAFGKARD